MTDISIGQGHHLDVNHTSEGKITWQSPSNIALIKYWGKRPVQIPQNASISYTLSDAHTITSVAYKPRAAASTWITFLFEGKEEPAFAARIELFLGSLADHFPFLSQLSLTIESSNSFPHSSGIASSASSMSALAMCLCDIERTLLDVNTDEVAFRQKASVIARLGSGSAARSVYPLLASWGVHDDLSGSSDLYASPYDDVAPIFTGMHDDVLIVSGEKKSVSSTAGHALMDTNPFATERYKQAADNMTNLLIAMRQGDVEYWGKIVESEAMTLHALMMCSDPSYVLMKPGTLAVIDALRAYREESKLPIYFTLDAGPNVHILYPDVIAEQAKYFIHDQLSEYAEDGLIISDRSGNGPVKMS